MMNQRRFLSSIVAAGAIAALASACSSSSGGSSSVSGGSQNSNAQTTVTIVADTPSVFLTDFYIAQQQGLFAKHNLKVDLTYSQNPEAVEVSGKANLMYETVLSGLESIEQGLGIKATMTVQVDTMPILLANKSVSSLAQLQSMSSCRIGTTAPGNTVYGYAAYWIKLLKLKCTLAIASSVPTMVAGAVSGEYQAVVTTPQYGPETASQGTHVLLNPLTIAGNGTPSVNPAFVAKYALPEAITTAIWGQSSYISANPTVIANLSAALAQAQQARKSMSFDQLAGLLAQANPGAFGTSVIPKASLERSLQYGIAPVVEEPITQSLWTSSLKSYTYYGAQNYQADNPDFDFAQVVVNS
jgi:ABC-type nitrate/sulfonate/bicarbonate transport system substrate-binding protein